MPKLSPFAGSALMSQGGSFEPQRVSNFAVIIPGLDNGEVLVLSTKSAEVPAFSVAKKGIKYFNTTAHYAGSLDPLEDFTIDYHDYLDRDVLGVLSRWYSKVYCPKTGAIGWAKDYKRQGSLLLLPPGMPAADCPGVVESEAYRDRVFVLKGIWPHSLKYSSLDHDSDGENAIVTLTLSVDLAYPKTMEQ